MLASIRNTRQDILPDPAMKYLHFCVLFKRDYLKKTSWNYSPKRACSWNLSIAIESREPRAQLGSGLPAQGVPVSEEQTDRHLRLFICVTLHFGSKTKGCFFFLTTLENLFLSYSHSEGLGAIKNKTKQYIKKQKEGSKSELYLGLSESPVVRNRGALQELWVAIVLYS